MSATALCHRCGVQFDGFSDKINDRSDRDISEMILSYPNISVKIPRKGREKNVICAIKPFKANSKDSVIKFYW